MWSYTPDHHKTQHAGKARVVFIGPKGQDVLWSNLLRDAGAFCFVPAEVAAATRVKRHANRKTPMSCGTAPE